MENLSDLIKQAQSGQFAPFPAPAKLNLFLHVVGQRADGYHLLQTVFRFIDYADTVWLSKRQDSEIRRVQDLPGVTEQQDLTLRAARLLQSETGCRWGVDVRLEKRLPQGGGLGGGSSDAATVLLALNRIWGLNLPRQRLQHLALQLGADVPVFVFGRNAFAEGVGERLQAVELQAAWYVVLMPPVQVATAGVFAAPELTRNTPAIKIADFLADGCIECTEFWHNDLEPVVRASNPRVDAALRWLESHGRARMTGSGACVFMPLADEQTARNIVQQRPVGLAGFAARGLDCHPLLGFATD